MGRSWAALRRSEVALRSLLVALRPLLAALDRAWPFSGHGHCSSNVSFCQKHVMFTSYYQSQRKTTKIDSTGCSWGALGVLLAALGPLLVVLKALLGSSPFLTQRCSFLLLVWEPQH